MRGLLRRLADNREPTSLAAALRRRRFDLFRSVLDPLPRPVRVLDVGGTEAYWTSMGAAAEPGVRVVLLNQTPPDVSLPGFEGVVGDARRMDGFGDGEFDVVFSNSVIEHVGDEGDQRAMADEVRRVGRRYVVQTPNRYFPIEPHFLMPGFQFLPEAIQVAMVRRFALGWYERIPDPERARELVRSHRLLSAREMHALFPDGELHRERVLGLVKSLVAIGPVSARA